MGAITLSALMMKYILYNGEDFSLVPWFVYGSIISATDPVAVVALLKELGASKRLSTMIEGESLLNDGTAMVIFLLFEEMLIGEEMTVGKVVGKFCRLSFLGSLVGLVAGIIVSYWLSRIHNDYVIEVNVTIFSAYLLFYLTESTSLHVSGILALVVLGLYMTRTGKTRISIASEHAVHHVWGYIGYVAETVVFILSGVIMGIRLKSDNSLQYFDFFKVLVAYILLHIIRFLMILMFYPCLKHIGYKMTFKQVILCSYSGLRGAVGLALALKIANNNDIIKYHGEEKGKRI